ncbi:MAG: thiamine phosphate synthase [Syntrophaceae bacterium]
MQGLYLVTDRQLCGARSLEDVVFQALLGGVACVQLREKDVPTRFFVKEAQKIKTLTKQFGVPLIINDRLDVALAIDADGVHIGQDDMPYETARKLMGPQAIIGLSVETWDDVVTAQELDVNYLGVSPVFETPTKTDTKGSWGLEGIARIKAYSRHPLVAIGGLNIANAEDAVMAGADCIAVVSAICAAPDPLQASRQLNTIIRAALKKRII